MSGRRPSLPERDTERWWRFHADDGSPSFYAWGTRKDAYRYSEHINRDRVFNPRAPSLESYPATVADLQAGRLPSVNLAKDLAALEQAGVLFSLLGNGATPSQDQESK
jgi:hypothetical protein